MVAGPAAAEEYLAGFLIEKSLSIDNLFVFALIFGYFAVPAAYQRRVIYWGIVGAIVLRADLHPRRRRRCSTPSTTTIYLFGAFLRADGPADGEAPLRARSTPSATRCCGCCAACCR